MNSVDSVKVLVGKHLMDCLVMSVEVPPVALDDVVYRSNSPRSVVKAALRDLVRLDVLEFVPELGVYRATPSFVDEAKAHILVHTLTHEASGVSLMPRRKRPSTKRPKKKPGPKKPGPRRKRRARRGLLY